MSPASLDIESWNASMAPLFNSMMNESSGIEVWGGSMFGRRRGRTASVVRVARAWPALATIGVVLSMVGAVHARQVDEAYWARVQVRFMEPLSAEVPNGLESNSSSLVAMAGIVQDRMHERSSSLIVSPDTLLVDTGVQHGSAVSVPNSGGQWATYFADPWLDVQVVGSTPEEVAAGVEGIASRVADQLTELQAAEGVDTPNRIRSRISPSGPVQIFVERGANSRAAAGFLLLGLLLTTMGVAGARRLISDPSINATPQAWTEFEPPDDTDAQGGAVPVELADQIPISTPGRRRSDAVTG